jgi:hypothetical protein
VRPGSALVTGSDARLGWGAAEVAAGWGGGTGQGDDGGVAFDGVQDRPAGAGGDQQQGLVGQVLQHGGFDGVLIDPLAGAGPGETVGPGLGIAPGPRHRTAGGVVRAAGAAVTALAGQGAGAGIVPAGVPADGDGVAGGVGLAVGGGGGTADPGADTPDVTPPGEAGNDGQPADTAADTSTADQPSRTDYATSLRAHDPWQATTGTTPDRPGRPTPEHPPPAGISSAGQETESAAQDRLPIADQSTDAVDPGTDAASHVVEDTGPVPSDQAAHSETTAASETAEQPPASDNASTPSPNAANDHHPDELTLAALSAQDSGPDPDAGPQSDDQPDSITSTQYDDQPTHPDSSSPTKVTQASPATAPDYPDSEAAEFSGQAGPDTGMLEEQDAELAGDIFQGQGARHERHAVEPAGESIQPGGQGTSASGASHGEPPVAYTAETGAEAATPEKIYVEGREILITHDPADGIWVEGLPGEIPGTPIGDPHGTVKIGEYLGESDAEDEDWLTRVPRAAAERFDDISDSVDKMNDYAFRFGDAASSRPGPTSAAVGVREHALGATAPGSELGQTVAHGIEAGLVATIVAARIWQAISNRHRARER